MIDISNMLEKLGSELVNSPYFSVMVVNKKYQIVWHNQRYAEELNNGKSLVGTPCFQSVGSKVVHAECPLHISIITGDSSKGFLDFGEQNFLYITIPLDEEHAAKVHIFLPKQP